MKRMWVLIALGALAASSALASSTTCPTTSLTAYLVGGFTCTSGNLTFGGFSFNTASTTTPIAASAVTVTPITATGNEGFTFQPSGMSVSNSGSNQNFFDITINYWVTDAFGINDLELAFDGTFTGTGLTRVSESYCLNQTTMTGCPPANSNVISVANPGGGSTNSVMFGAVTSIAVSKDVVVASGTNGTAMLTFFNNQFSQSLGVPEPLTFGLLGTGLAGLLLIRKRLHKR